MVHAPQMGSNKIIYIWKPKATNCGNSHTILFRTLKKDTFLKYHKGRQNCLGQKTSQGKKMTLTWFCILSLPSVC